MTVPSLSPSALIAAASEGLEAGGYRRVESGSLDISAARMFEDAYGVALVIAYETFNELLDGWTEAQDQLVGTMSRFWQRGEPKTWDGYLVLLTGAEASDRYAEVERLRYDTSRVRKLIGTGEDVRNLSDIERFLSPLLPIRVETHDEQSIDALDALPDLLGGSVPPELMRVVLDAYRREQPLLEAIDQELHGERRA